MSLSEPVAVLHGPGDVRVEQRPVAQPAAHEVLVEVSAVGICGSDVHYFEHGRLGPNVVRAPHVLGHEVSGLVVACGREVRGDRVGERVAVEPGVPCGACAECASGRYNLCTRVRFLGTPPVDGALRGHVAIHAAFANPLPDSVSDQAGALIEPLAVAVWACRRGTVAGGDRVLITGAGPIGLLSAQVALAYGAAEVTIVDLSDLRLALARRLGVSSALRADELDRSVGASVLIECSGAAGALRAGIAAVRPGGRVVVVGMPPEPELRLPVDDLVRRELTVLGSFRYAGCYEEAIELAASGRVALEPLITGRYSLTDVGDALRAVREDPAHVKAVVIPGD